MSSTAASSAATNATAARRVRSTGCGPGRLAEAGTDLDILADRLLSAERAANAFWSGIGHIGVEDTRVEARGAADGGIGDTGEAR